MNWLFEKTEGIMMNQKPTLKKKHVINSKLGETRDQNELGFGSPSDWLLRRRKFS